MVMRLTAAVMKDYGYDDGNGDDYEDGGDDDDGDGDDDDDDDGVADYEIDCREINGKAFDGWTKVCVPCPEDEVCPIQDATLPRHAFRSRSTYANLTLDIKKGPSRSIDFPKLAEWAIFASFPMKLSAA